MFELCFRGIANYTFVVCVCLMIGPGQECIDEAYGQVHLSHWESYGTGASGVCIWNALLPLLGVQSGAYGLGVLHSVLCIYGAWTSNLMLYRRIG